jgi:hypothetical protein
MLPKFLVFVHLFQLFFEQLIPPSTTILPKLQHLELQVQQQVLQAKFPTQLQALLQYEDQSLGEQDLLQKREYNPHLQKLFDLETTLQTNQAYPDNNQVLY